MEVQPDFKDLCELFNRHEVDSGKASETYGGVPVHYMGRRQFITNKKATGRKKDLADLEALGED